MTTWQDVTSSNLKAIGMENHDPVKKTCTVLVKFLTGPDVWQYEGVPFDVWEAFKIAPSAGSYFAKNLKGRYGGKKKGGFDVT